MLTNRQIKTLATKLQTTEHNIAQEYCQHVFLSIFYQQPDSEQVFFKGGTALRIIFNSPRFSEDLDFSSQLPSRQLQKLLKTTLKKMSNFGLNPELQEAKSTSGGFLAIFSCSLAGLLLRLQIEISGRAKKKLAGEIFTINPDYLPAYTLLSLKTENLVAEKIQAALNRQKPRDFFDIYFLLRSRLISPRQKKNLEKIKTQLEKTNRNFSAELKQFLPISYQPLIKNFSQTLQREIKRNI